MASIRQRDRKDGSVYWAVLYKHLGKQTSSSFNDYKEAVDFQARITADSLQTHRARHFNIQAGASALWRRILEERAAAESADYERGVVNLVTPRVFFELMMVKSYAALADEATTISVDQGLAAARELGKLTGHGADDEQKWAEAHVQLNRIVKVMREIVPARYHQAILDTLEGRETAARSIEAEVDEEDEGEFDPADDDDFEEEDWGNG
jgi:hypothetical protein